MTVQSDAVERGQKELKTDWPHVEGLELGTTKISGKDQFLQPQEKRLISKEQQKGIY